MRHMLLMIVIIACCGCQQRVDSLFPELHLDNGQFVVAPFHGCANCFNKIMKFSDQNQAKFDVIIIALNRAEFKALKAVHMDSPRIHVLMKYDNSRIESNMSYYLEVSDGKIDELKLIRNEELDTFLANFL